MKPSLLIVLGTLVGFICCAVSAAGDVVDSRKTELHIVALGTSLTANYTWPYKLSQALAECQNKKIVIEVVARSGENSTSALSQFASRKELYPDIVLVEFMTNDADWLDGVKLEKSMFNHQALVKNIRESVPHAKIFLMTMNPVYGFRGLIRYKLSKYNKLYEELLDGGWVISVDMSALWAKKLGDGGYKKIIPDGLHPTDAAAESVIVQRLAHLICR